jgi:hypothetical protein
VRRVIRILRRRLQTHCAHSRGVILANEDPLHGGYGIVATSDGEKLVAWYVAPKANKPLVVYFRGNGDTS